jgi:hypothetical protein
METIDLFESFFAGIAVQPLWKFQVLGLLVAALILLLAWDCVRQPSQMLAFTTERGQVFLSRRAITEMIARVAARTHGVAKCKSTLKRRSGKLSITLHLTIRADADLVEIERRLETQIVEVLSRNLGFQSLGTFTTKAVSVVGELGEPRGASRAAATAVPVSREAELRKDAGSTPAQS